MAELALRDYLNEIDRLIERSSNNEAIQHCRHILTQLPKCVEAYRLLGKALLEQEEDPAAQDVFERVLSVDPEDFVARVGLSIIHDRNNELDLAIWHMERAFDIAPSNELIQGELRRLYARRDGVTPERIALSRSALARMYAKGDLYAEAIADLRKLLDEQPGRLDLQVQLAEVLWRNTQRLDAIDWTQRVIKQLPNCVKANLINGAVLRDNGELGESESIFKRAQAVDPENHYAAELFGPDGPLSHADVMVSRLELPGTEELLEAAAPVAELEEVPEWLRGITDLETLETSPLEAGESYPPLAAGTYMPEAEPAAEIPAWLQGLAPSGAPAAEEEVPDWLAALAGGAAVAAVAGREEKPEEPETSAPAMEEETPDWLAALAGGAAVAAVAGREEKPEEPETPAPAMEEETPDWLAALAGEAAAAALADQEQATPQAVSSADEVGPDWLSQLGVSAAETTPVQEDETPDWLYQLQETMPAPFPTTDSMGVEPEEETPDWLAKLQASEPAPAGEEATAAETPDWLRALGAAVTIDQMTEPGLDVSEVAAGMDVGAEWWMQTGEDQAEEIVELESIPFAPPVPEPPSLEEKEPLSFETAAPAGEEEAPLMVAEEMPSADDALAFLARLAAGKEDQLRAEAQAEADRRMAEIMGRKAEARPVEPTEEKPGAGAVLAAGAIAAGAAMVKAREEGKKEEPQPPEAQVVAEEPRAAEPTAVPEEMPSADDALAFLAKLAAGKEDQLRAEAQAEAETRMAEIMGRKVEAKPAEPKVEEAGAVAGGAAPQPAEAQVVAEAPKAAEATAVPEEMPSADDALAFLARLAAGKEDQLRAEAQAEAETRMAEIMGRKVEARPAAPQPEEKSAPVKMTVAAATVAAVAAGLAGKKAKKEEPPPIEPTPIAEVPKAEEPVAVPEEMPSADDALAFLAKLAAGKEDQLRAEAQAEAETRMAEIMGRKAEARPVKPQEEQPTAGAVLAGGMIAAGLAAQKAEEQEAPPEPAALESEAADWLSKLQPYEEMRPVETTPESELPEWLQSMKPSEEIAATPEGELPDWLKSMRPSDTLLTESDLVAGEESEAPEATPVSELPDWLQAMHPVGPVVEDQFAEAEPQADLAAQLEETAPETPPEPAEAAVSFGIEAVAAETSIEKQPVAWWMQTAEDEGGEPYQLVAAETAGQLSLDWWVQSAQDEDEEPLSELPEPAKSALVTAPESGRLVTPAGKKPTQPLPPKTGPLAKSGPLPKTGPIGLVEAQSNIESLLSRLYANEEDQEARLELARTYWATGKREDAFVTYSRLAMSYTYAKEIVPDLESITEIQDQPDWHRLMGDVYMKAGKFTVALEHYRRALSEL